MVEFNVNYGQILAAVLIFLLGWLVSWFTPLMQNMLLRRYLGPKLRLVCNNDRDCKLDVKFELLPPQTHGHLAPARMLSITVPETYVRIKVENELPRTAKGCRGYLVGVMHEADGGQWTESSYSETIPLIWAYNPEAIEIEIPQGVTRYLDVARASQNQEGLIPQFRFEGGKALPVPDHYKNIFEFRGLCRWTIALAADDVKPEFIDVELQSGYPTNVVRAVQRNRPSRS